MAAESTGISQNAKSRQRSLYALAQLGFVDTDKLLNSICRNDFVLGTVPEQCHSRQNPFPRPPPQATCSPRQVALFLRLASESVSTSFHLVLDCFQYVRVTWIVCRKETSQSNGDAVHSESRAGLMDAVNRRGESYCR